MKNRNKNHRKRRQTPLRRFIRQLGVLTLISTVLIPCGVFITAVPRGGATAWDFSVISWPSGVGWVFSAQGLAIALIFPISVRLSNATRTADDAERRYLKRRRKRKRTVEVLQEAVDALAAEDSLLNAVSLCMVLLTVLGIVALLEVFITHEIGALIAVFVSAIGLVAADATSFTPPDVSPLRARFRALKMWTLKENARRREEFWKQRSAGTKPNVWRIVGTTVFTLAVAALGTASAPAAIQATAVVCVAAILFISVFMSPLREPGQSILTRVAMVIVVTGMGATVLLGTLIVLDWIVSIDSSGHRWTASTAVTGAFALAIVLGAASNTKTHFQGLGLAPFWERSARKEIENIQAKELEVGV